LKYMLECSIETKELPNGLSPETIIAKLNASGKMTVIPSDDPVDCGTFKNDDLSAKQADPLSNLRIQSALAEEELGKELFALFGIKGLFLVYPISN